MLTPVASGRGRRLRWGTAPGRSPSHHRARAARRSATPPHLPWDAAAVIANLGHRVAKGYWQHPSPTVWPPAHTYRRIRVLAGETLPDARYRRHLLWRYSLVWVRPAAEGGREAARPGGRAPPGPPPAGARVG